jgi:hypothetical protein
MQTLAPEKNKDNAAKSGASKRPAYPQVSRMKGQKQYTQN